MFVNKHCVSNGRKTAELDERKTQIDSTGSECKQGRECKHVGGGQHSGLSM